MGSTKEEAIHPVGVGGQEKTQGRNGEGRKDSERKTKRGRERATVKTKTRTLGREAGMGDSAL